MDTQTFLDNFGTIARAPGGIERLRELTLALAMGGRLVGRDSVRRTSTDWVEYTLAELTALSRPICYGVLKPGPHNSEGVPLIKIRDLDKRSGTVRASNLHRISHELNAEYQRSQLEGGELLISIQGTIGRVAICPDDLAGANISRTLAVIKTDERVDRQFLRWYLEYLAITDSFTVVGTTRASLNIGTLRKMSIPAPPLAEQHRIVAKVDELMALCDQLETQQQTRTQTATKLQTSALNALTTAETADDLQTAWDRIHTNWEALASDPEGVEELRDLVLELAVRGRLTEREPEDDSVRELLATIQVAVQEEATVRGRRSPKPFDLVSSGEQPFGISESWVWVRLGQLGLTQTGTTPKKDKLGLPGPTIPFIRPASISWDGISAEADSIPLSAAKEAGRLAGPGTVLMVCIGTIGKTALLQYPATFNQQINALEVVVCNPDYVMWALRSPMFQKSCVQKSAATTIRILNKSKWESLPVPLPPLPEQHRIVAKVDELMDLCDELEARLVERDRIGEALATSVVDAFAA